MPVTCRRFTQTAVGVAGLSVRSTTPGTMRGRTHLNTSDAFEADPKAARQMSLFRLWEAKTGVKTHKMRSPALSAGRRALSVSSNVISKFC